MIALIPFYRTGQSVDDGVDHNKLLVSCVERISESPSVTDIYIATDLCPTALPSVPGAVVVAAPLIDGFDETKTMLQVLLDQGVPDTAMVAVIDYRAIRCGKSAIGEAVSKLKTDPEGRVVSVHAMRNSVCRASSYQRVQAMDVIFLRDESAYSRSMPFHFDWKGHGLDEKDDSCIYDMCHGRETFVSSINQGESVARWKRLSLNTAQLVFPGNGLRSYSCGTSPFTSEFRLENEPSRDENILYLDDQFSDSSALWVYPFDERGFIPDSRKVVNLNGETRVPVSLDSKASGCVVFGMTSVSSGTYHMEKSFPSIEGLLRWEHGKAVNVQTDKKIHGRQAFPDIYRANGILLAGKLEHLLERGNDFNGAIPLVMKREAAVVVNKSIEALVHHRSAIPTQSIASQLQQSMEHASLRVRNHIEDQVHHRSFSKMLFIFKLLNNGFGDSDTFHKSADFMELCGLQQQLMAEASFTRKRKNKRLAEQSFVAGKAAFDSGDYEASLGYWETVLKYNPGHPGVREYLQRLEDLSNNTREQRVESQMGKCI